MKKKLATAFVCYVTEDSSTVDLVRYRFYVSK
jgi:hypothetical protein